MREIKITGIPCNLVEIGFAPGMEVDLKIHADVSAHLDQLESWSPGIGAKCKELAVKEGDAEKVSLDGPRPEIGVTLRLRGDRSQVLDQQQARLRSASLRVTKKAEKVTLIMAWRGVRTVAEWAALGATGYGDIVIDAHSLATAEAPKPKRGRKKKQSTAEVNDPRQTSIPGTGDEAAVAMAAADGADGGESGPVQ